MSVLWERSPLAAGEIIAILETKAGWRPRTIRTLLDRLVQKGALKLHLEGKRHYAPSVTMEACVRRESRSFFARVFAGEPAPLLLHVIKESKLTRKEIEQLKRLLSEKEL